MIDPSNSSTFTAFVKEFVKGAVFSVGGGGGYVIRLDTLYILLNKRELKVDRTLVSIAALELRQATFLPTFASSCRAYPTRFSSACTCLIGFTGATTVIKFSFAFL